MQLGRFDESLMPIYVFGRHLMITESDLNLVLAYRLRCFAIEHWISNTVTRRFLPNGSDWLRVMLL